MAQPVINIRLPVPSQYHMLPRQYGQQRQRQAIQHDTQDYAAAESRHESLPEHPVRALASDIGWSCAHGIRRPGMSLPAGSGWDEPRSPGTLGLEPGRY